MVVSCVAFGCTNRFKKGTGIKFFRFPKNENQRLKWVNAIRRTNWISKSYDRICSKHFISGCPSTDILHPDYKPTIFSFNENAKKSSARFERHSNRTSGSGVRPDNKQQEPVADGPFQQEDVGLTADRLCELSSTNTLNIDNILLNQTLEENGNLKKQNKQLLKELQILQEENLQLRNRLGMVGVRSNSISEKRLQYYTGLQSRAIFTWIVHLASNCLPHLLSLNKEDQVLLVLMKLRLGLFHQDLAYRFNISLPTVSRVFNVTIPILSERLKFLIRWQTSEEIKLSLPKCFRKKFSHCKVVIDCSELFIERPFNLTARSQTWSHYKHHNTIKFLIGINPNGAISFLSDCWGGRVSDKELTARSGFYDFLRPGDMVMADRGFLIEDELSFRRCTLVIPPFTKGKNQLSGVEVSHAREISSARIHVERIIGRIKRFNILNTVIPITLQPNISNVVIICGALVNLKTSIT